MRSPWRRVALHPMTGPSKRQKRRDPDTEEKPREDGGRDGREVATSPGTPGAPQKLEEAGRTLPWSLQKEPTLEHLDLRRLVSRYERG